LRRAVRRPHVQGQNIDAHKICARAVKRNERWHFERQALLVIVADTFAFFTGAAASRMAF